MNYFKLLGLFIWLSLSAHEKILIISHHYAQPFFIEIQAKTFKKFIKDDYEFVIFNDAKTKALEVEINHYCKEYNIRCIRIDPSIHNRPYLPRVIGENYNHPCIRCANVVQYSLDLIGFDYDGRVVIIDSDMFPIKPFSFNEFMEGYDLVGVPQSRGPIYYLWNGLVMFDMRTLPDRKTINFNCGTIEGQPVDAGGYTYHYLKKFGHQIQLKTIGPTYIRDTLKCFNDDALDPSLEHLVPLLENVDENFNMEIFIAGTFLHYRGGGLWDPKPRSYYQRKNRCLINYINYIMKNS